MDRITIEEQKKYDVVFGSNITNSEIKTTILDYEQVVFFIDDKVKVGQEVIHDQLCYYFTACEANKNLVEYEKMIKYLLANNFQRKKSIIVAIGGGVTLDLVGYVAATYKRGIDVLYVPTTLLAMVDVAVGSKNTINLGPVKNAVGTFKSPEKVVIDINYLKTLDQRNFNNGMAEVIKYGAIKDVTIIDQLLTTNYELLKLIKQSIMVKQYFIERDNHDFGIRQSLNFGHTIGHAIEAYYNYDTYLHGEAVAIGMNLIYPNSKLEAVCKKFNLPTALNGITISDLKPQMLNDKKNENQQIKIITLKKLGEVNANLQTFSC